MYKGEVFVNTTKTHRRSGGIAPLIFQLGSTLYVFENKTEKYVKQTESEGLYSFSMVQTFITETPEKLLMSR
jgi:hypothetical protein